ncbi:hypothetical protein MTX26_18940 [Bradyrhizobium sp. ISRA443]|uniref:hypothetical protein n=1 Tax=unclassified Bradyrhizobium TaxID=2631580 RepID=UPI002478B378|nr:MULTISPECIES: hypothetical protein [unclassified Bradyrhizobium]WGR92241.1 hypothetical protein MTX20_29605 [Bradyrhizobium sp. ISRA435]WGR96545.1 hypothetical protein MTX23_18940 [Bradyrhizobium sp. ISRA436]WGS03432.1 hypothetical protein MTX18_18940 [Bradyrhizobium sp. ISRA437]WGS10316.1 hypothetical protein MTX26_18940 [Bradyrhizobium sp. ISRA443]
MSSIRNWVGKAAVLLLPIALGACAQYAQYGMTTAPSGSGPLAWDGAGRDPNLPPPQRHARNASPAVAQSSDDQQTAAADDDDRLARKLVICSTCIKPPAPQPSDRQDVASIANQR